MRSPLAGVVSSLPFAKGDTVITSDKVLVIGKGSVLIQLQVSESAFRVTKVGQHAAIAQPGAPRVSGVVSALGLLPTQSTTASTPTFPVTVTASGREAAKLSLGATASVTLTVASAKNALVVPVSAVTMNSATAGSGANSSSNATVSVLTGGAAKTVAVTVGAVGSTTVQVTSGLTEGQTVILADHTTALPANSSNLNRRIAAGGGGGFGGAGGGGFGGAGTAGQGRAGGQPSR